MTKIICPLWVLLKNEGHTTKNIWKNIRIWKNIPYIVGGGGGQRVGQAHKKNSECWYIFHIPPPWASLEIWLKKNFTVYYDKCNHWSSHFFKPQLLFLVPLHDGWHFTRPCYVWNSQQFFNFSFKNVHLKSRVAAHHWKTELLFQCCTYSQRSLINAWK